MIWENHIRLISFHICSALLEEIMEKYRNTICMSNRIRQINERKLYRMEHLRINKNFKK